MKIAVGTTSSWKIEFLDDVLSEMGVSAEIATYDVDSGVTDQPTNEAKTRKGSVVRAKNAWNESDKADFALGVEVGYQRNDNDKFEMFCYATAVNDEHSVTRCSSKLILPNLFQRVLAKDENMHEFVEGYEERDGSSAYSYLVRVIRYREQFIKEAVRNTLMIFLNPEEY